jgi:ferredoxin
MTFVQSESCGKCVPCREGTKQMLTILERIVAGHGGPGDIPLLEELGSVIRDGSLCGLGKSAPNPVLSTLRYFRDEFEEHVHDKRCRAGVCAALLNDEVLADRCRGCTLCIKVCPTSAITGERGKPHRIDPAKCIKCKACIEKCRFEAIRA